MVRAPVLTLLGGLLLATSVPGGAQSVVPVQAAIIRGDELHEAMKPSEALTIFEEVLFDAPRNYEVLWRAARESVALGSVATEGRVRKGRFRQAETYARLAIGADRERPEGHYWLAVTLAKQARIAAPQARVSLLEDVRREASAVLALDPESPGGLHVMGVWHADVMRLSGLASLVARKVLAGEALKTASWEEAERLLARAADLEPECLAHHLELALVLMDVERPDPAREHLQQVLTLPATEPGDAGRKDQARALLMALRDGRSG